ncbi:MAG: SAM-dependent methyltransferase [Pseudonocardiales bacterium]|nr:MAG: SAM-dependent methyltransferase [Pseudonocardiales bacterium]
MNTALDELIRPDRYPLSSKYDPAWLAKLDMGPNPLWLLEDLCHDLELRPGMRVLDLGSGKGATSVFLAREFSVDVVAADLWVSPDDAAAVFAEAGVADRVHAVKAEAHTLPFAANDFDAIISIDAFEYFGTADNYLAYILGFLKPAGQLAMATPGLKREIRELGEIPAHIKRCVGWEAIAWHTAEWWRFQWEITELVSVHAARLQDSGWDDWLRWHTATSAASGSAPDPDDTVRTMLDADQGEYLSFALVAARKLG